MKCRCRFCVDLKHRENRLKQLQRELSEREPYEMPRGETKFKLSRPLPSARMQWDDCDSLLPSIPWLQQKLDDHMQHIAAVTSKVVTEGT